VTFELSLFQAIYLFAAGAVLGIAFFGGLWWTVHEMPTSKRPALLFLSSLLVRLAVLLMGVYFLGQGHWQRYAALLLGIITARTLAARWSRTMVRAKEIDHAA